MPFCLYDPIAIKRKKKLYQRKKEKEWRKVKWILLGINFSFLFSPLKIVSFTWSWGVLIVFCEPPFEANLFLHDSSQTTKSLLWISFWFCSRLTLIPAPDCNKSVVFQANSLADPSFPCPLCGAAVGDDITPVECTVALEVTWKWLDHSVREERMTYMTYLLSICRYNRCS